MSLFIMGLLHSAMCGELLFSVQCSGSFFNLSRKWKKYIWAQLNWTELAPSLILISFFQNKTCFVQIWVLSSVTILVFEFGHNPSFWVVTIFQRKEKMWNFFWHWHYCLSFHNLTFGIWSLLEFLSIVRIWVLS